MNSPYSPEYPNRNKILKWTANHLGSFLQKSVSKDMVSSAIGELSLQLTDGRFRELQCIIEINKEKQILCIRRWLDNISLEEFNLSSISNVNSFGQVPQNKTLFNIVTFTTQMKLKESVSIETHIFHLEDISSANNLAADIKDAIDASRIVSNNNAVKVLLPKTIDNGSKMSKFESFHQHDDIICKTERNLLLLNYCFDDIELFLLHLKDQEEALIMLTSNKNGSSDRLLQGKAKPSTKIAYTNCIQKIKFSLNLLSKLDGKIQNPDSQQLSLLMLENLVKIGQAYSLNHDDKISRVKEPLLTERTLKMLQNSLSNYYLKQLSNWGEFWMKPREKWIGYEERYYPEFLNGCKIDLNDLIKDGIVSSAVDHKNVSLNHSVTNNLFQANSVLNVTPISPSQTKGNPIINQNVDNFCRCVSLNGGRLFKVINTFNASKDAELSVFEGDIIEVIDLRPDRNWWLCGNLQGQKGYCPCTILEQFQYTDKSPRADVIANDLSFPDTKGSLNNSLNSRKVSVSPKLPKNSVSFEKSIAEAKAIRDDIKSKIKASPSFTSPLGRASFVRPDPVISKKHGQLSINQDSTNINVQNWLKFKKFSDGDIEKLKDFTGQTIFLLTRDEMIRIVGVEVAARLDSLIKVQKSMSGFGTLSKKELNDILLKRRNHLDFDESF